MSGRDRTEYYRAYHQKNREERLARMREYIKTYRGSEQGKATIASYRKTEKYKAARKIYGQNEKRKIAQSRRDRIRREDPKRRAAIAASVAKHRLKNLAAIKFIRGTGIRIADARRLLAA